MQRNHWGAEDSQMNKQSPTGIPARLRPLTPESLHQKRRHTSEAPLRQNSLERIQKCTRITGSLNARLDAELCRFFKTRFTKSKIKQWFTAVNGLKLFLNNTQTPSGNSQISDVSSPCSCDLCHPTVHPCPQRLVFDEPFVSLLSTNLPLLAAIAQHSSQPCVDWALIQIRPDLPRPRPLVLIHCHCLLAEQEQHMSGTYRRTTHKFDLLYWFLKCRNWTHNVWGK